MLFLIEATCSCSGSLQTSSGWHCPDSNPEQIWPPFLSPSAAFQFKLLDNSLNQIKQLCMRVCGISKHRNSTIPGCKPQKWKCGKGKINACEVETCLPGTSLCLTSHVNAYIGFGSFISLCGTALLCSGLLAKVSARAGLSALHATAWCAHGISVAESSIRAVREHFVILDTFPLPRKLKHKPRSQLLISCPCSIYWADSAPADSSSKFLAAHIYLVALDMGLISLCWISYGQMEHGAKIPLH